MILLGVCREYRDREKSVELHLLPWLQCGTKVDKEAVGIWTRSESTRKRAAFTAVTLIPAESRT